MADTPRKPVVRFGVFELDLAARQLRKNGTRIKLQDQPFRVLQLLLERPGEIVAREELREKLWSDDTFVEFDHSLNTAIQKIRRALGDSADNPRFVETVPRIGYRFVSPVNSGHMPLDPTARTGQIEPDQASRPAHQPNLSKYWYLAGTVALVAIVLASQWLGVFSASEEQDTYVATPLTAYRGHELQPSFSPDGSQVAFSWNGEEMDDFDIYVKVLGLGEPRPLTTDPADDLSPAWSPDGRRIAFVRRIERSSGGTAEVHLMPALGGPAQKLHEAVYRSLRLDEDSLLAWTSDGSWLAAPCRPDTGFPIGLCLLSPQTRETRTLTVPPTGCNGDMGPSFSPDGRTLAFSRLCGSSTADIYLLELDDDLKPIGEAQRLTYSNRWSLSPAWLPDGRDIIFFSDEAGSGGQLRRISPRAPDSARTLWLTGGSQGHVGIHASARNDEVKLAYASRQRDSNVWRLELGEGQPHAAERFLASTRRDVNPQFSPDGRQIAFVSVRSGTAEIWICDSDRSNLRRLTRTGARTTGFPRWSPKGRKIAFHSRPEGQADIFVVSVEDGTLTRLTSHSADDLTPSWSRSGEWVYFISRRGGAISIWKVPSAGGDAVNVTQEMGFAPFESWDGQWLFFQQASALRKLSLSQHAVQAESVEVLDSFAGLGGYAVVEEGLYFLAGPDGFAEELRFLDFASNRTREIARLNHEIGLGLALSPDRRSVLYTVIEQTGGDLTLLENVR